MTDGGFVRGAAAHFRHVGAARPRRDAKRLAAGGARYTDDVRLPRLVHVAFLRSPHAHARLRALDMAACRGAPGVVAAVTGADLAAMCRPFRARLEHLPSLKAPAQYPMAVDVARYQGEAVAAVAAETRAQAEDALERIAVEWEALPAVVDPVAALAPGAPRVHGEYDDNLAFTSQIAQGRLETLQGGADCIVRQTFRFARHTGVPLEPRSIVAEYDAAAEFLTVHLSTQTPYQNQAAIAAMYGLAEQQIRVIAPDVGGSFGIKLHTYADEMAVCGIALLLKRPVKFVADRLESFASDIHARGQTVEATLAATRDGRFTALSIDALSGIGPYSVYPRTSILEGSQVLALTGTCYRFDGYQASLRLAFQNKTPMGAYRAVGHPIAAAVTEGLVDAVARRVGIDPVEIRRRNLVRDDAYPHTTLTGLFFERLSHETCLDMLVRMMDYAALRREQARLRDAGIYRGIGLAAVVELTNPAPSLYGVGNVAVSAQDGCVVKLEPSGAVTCHGSVTDQGQGTRDVLAQVVADAVGVLPESVRVILGDTQSGPYGGGTYGSRAAGVGGEAALRAGLALRESLLRIAGALLQHDPRSLTILDGSVRDAAGHTRMSVAEIARVAYFRPDSLPKDLQPALSASGHFTQLEHAFVFTNGFQASHVEVDTDTGFVRLLKHWAVEDCGRVLNPMLVTEQIRGGVVQGIGAALFEQIRYDENGQLQNATMADYLVPMAAEMPDIEVAHVETPTATSLLGAKGAGEAGTAGAPAAVMNAVNDALAPFRAEIFSLPITPQAVLRAIGTLETS